MHKPTTLIILDGFGIAPATSKNAVTQANMPNFNSYWDNYPHTELEASGLAVGLPKGTQGGSEPGHLTIGAGRIVHQPLVAIDLAIEDGSFYENEELLKAF